MTPEDPPAPKRQAFISYRHESEDHRRAVLHFCQRLTTALGDGSVEIINDQTLLESRPAGPDEGWNRWSMNNAAHAERVIGIVSPGWFAAMDQKELKPPPGGKGSAVEATVIFNRHTDGRTVSPWLRLVRLPTFPDTETNWLMRDIPVFLGDSEDDVLALGRWLKSSDSQGAPAPPSATAPPSRSKPPAPTPRRTGPMVAAAAGAAVLLVGGFFLAKPLIGGLKKADLPEPGNALSPTAAVPTAQPSASKPAAPVLPEKPAAGTLGEVPLDATTTMRFRWCPPGVFKMGRIPDELPHVISLLDSAEEWDRHQLDVTLAEGIWMAETELTQKQLSALRGTAPTTATEGDDLPVDGIPHSEAGKIAAELTKKLTSTGWTARLPDEAEWEYACRAGTTGMFAFGEEIDRAQANFDPSYTLGKSGGIKGPGKAVPVRKYRANAWGLFDMHGNVSEWCAWVEHPSRSLSPPPEEGKFPVRGGAFDSYWIRCTSGARSFIKGEPGNNRTGLRLMLTQSPTP